MANWTLPEISPWRRRGLKIPPDSFHAWVRLGTWEFGMGVLLYVIFGFGTQLIASAPHSIVTVFDFTNCYAAPPVALPCERVAYRAGVLNAALNAWCGLLLIAVAAWLVWDLWSAAAPRPITDDFLRLLEDSFARDWRKPRTWPWTRVAWAYGFALVGVTSGVGMSLLISALSASLPARTPTVETSQQSDSVTVLDERGVRAVTEIGRVRRPLSTSPPRHRREVVGTVCSGDDRDLIERLAPPLFVMRPVITSGASGSAPWPATAAAYSRLRRSAR